MRPPTATNRLGFTLIELLVVITIIGIVLSVILAASYAGVEYTKVQATRELITKLDVAVSDRLDALLSVSPVVTENYTDSGGTRVPYPTLGTHQALATVLTSTTPTYAFSTQRAQLIAQIDMIRAEMPDVFYIDTSNTNYPLNFGGVADPGGYISLPMGAEAANAANAANYTAGTLTNPPAPYQITGINGASFSAIGSLVKSLGFQPHGYDGLDNDGVNGIDDIGEAGAAGTAGLAKLRANHKHKTARSEMLYALLVDGLGPLGSTFSPDDFTAREVKDTDGDGLLELIDAWGEPLQFYRWPIYHDSDFQKGYLPYGTDPISGAPQEREQNPLDPNQQLMAPAWFLGQAIGTTPTPPAAPATGSNPAFFQTMFFTLVDPQTGGSTTPYLWDRGGTYTRRAYNSKALILSAGPDNLPGVAQLGVDYSQFDSNASGAVAINALNLIQVENQAARLDPNRSGTYSEQTDATNTHNTATTALIQTWALDDITNQNAPVPGGPR